MMWDFCAAAEAIAAYLADALDLERAPIADEFARAWGRWKDADVCLRTRAWRGPSVAFFRSVTLEGGGLEIANLLAIPAPSGGDMIFGADLVSAKPGTALIVADLSPANRGTASANPHLGLPEWARAIFSDTPVVRRITPAERADALQQVHAVAEHFVSASRGAGRSHASLDGLARYMQGHREDDRTRSMLAHIFGPAWAERFVDTVMYPLSFPPHTSDRIDNDAA